MSDQRLPSADELRLAASKRLDPEKRVELGQFLTPSAIADFMAGLFERWPAQTRLLDPGAGIGSLTSGFVSRWLKNAPKGSELELTAYEIDPTLVEYLSDLLTQLAGATADRGHTLKHSIIERDFIVEAAFSASFNGPRYTHVILNPPYRKISTGSEHRRLLSRAGIETVNLYTAFLALSVAVCEPGGEIVAIVPRSFCNGTYYRPFRKWLMQRAAIRHIHVFGSRQKAFEDDDVLQENVIIHLAREAGQQSPSISTSTDATFDDLRQRRLPFEEIVNPSDPERFIHIPLGGSESGASLFRYALADLGLDVATGPVVDFRLKDHWVHKPGESSVPLLYSHHFRAGFQWPREHKKPNGLALNDATRKWLMPRGWYTVTKRFSSKEERRRIVAYVVDPSKLPGAWYGFENHLNVIHRGKRGMPEELARGLAVFLNSTAVDLQFRKFSGHTQVNATDLRTMKFPSVAELVRFGEWSKTQTDLTQEAIDHFIDHQECQAGDKVA
ncbi:MAG TPA: Eco57I restriction-modification methylase domain-containing protein [Micropepsaceae bacterium]|nr:Eco57I restriction-modification methylase domain-containing protein [Micropepsaceae bacterium]